MTDDGNFQGCWKKDCDNYPRRSVAYMSDEIVYSAACRMCEHYKPFDFYRKRRKS